MRVPGRLLAILALAVVSVLAGCGLAPQAVECRSLDPLQCIRVADAVQAEVGNVSIGRLAIIGYRDCLPLPVSRPLLAAGTEAASLNAVAAVQFADPAKGSALFDVSGLDSFGPLRADPMQGLGADAVFDQDLFRQ